MSRTINRLNEERFENPPEQPFSWVQDWLEQAKTADLLEPTAMNLATLDAQGRPANRVVLCKGFADNEVHFYTNYSGRKGQELLKTPTAALCFWWDQLDRQIRLQGRVRQLPAAESDAYFASRPRGSQLGAWASDQSRPIASRRAMEERYAQIEERFTGVDSIPRPPHWGGFALSADWVELWQGQANRFHDRVTYTRQSDASWSIERLQP
nr:pyridoxamine 5'-phosphate oxidase [Oceanococcus sp. HetDA_MAG_MS8]